MRLFNCCARGSCWWRITWDGRVSGHHRPTVPTYSNGVPRVRGVLTAVGDPKQTIMQWAGLSPVSSPDSSRTFTLPSFGRPSITAPRRSWFESKLSLPLLSRTKTCPKLLQEILQTIQANAASSPSRIRALKRASWPHRLSPGSTKTACSPETSASSPEIDLPFTPVSFKTSFKISALRLALNPSFKIS
jgi:hypothetical protein